MLKLTNIASHPNGWEPFYGGAARLADYLHRNGLDGIEASQDKLEGLLRYPKGSVVGIHMYFWPICLDFFKGDIAALRKQFGDDEVWQHYYQANNRDELVVNYREGLKAACDIGSKYVVFHISHTTLNDSFTLHHSSTDQDVLDAFTDILNDVLEGFNGEIVLLFENLWWPGLTLLDEAASLSFLSSINYANKGFMLDVGHMMITNPDLTTHKQAAEYITQQLSQRPSLSKNIRGIHLNSSLTGEYLQAVAQGQGIQDIEGNFWDRFANAYKHIFQIDTHLPFADYSVRNILDAVEIDYLVFELAADNLPALEHHLKTQLKYL